MKAKLGLVVSEFNNEITYKMLARAKQYIKRADASIRYVCYVPGSFDMPLMIGELLKKKDVDAVVTLGAVIKGETGHDEIIAGNVARLIADLSLRSGKPVSLGVTGPSMTIEQAMERIEIIPMRAVDAAIKMVFRMRKIRNEKLKSYTMNSVSIIK
ncbi:MAG: 6,7-dimethyl-8-ribityllumazine synthase [Nitrososphaeraceae archaeon]